MKSGEGGAKVARLTRIEGRVQGVGFRYWVEGHARRLELRGYVRNLTDGAVEALLVGAERDVARMLALLEEGPPAAHVERVASLPAVGAAPSGFRRAPTGAPGTPA